MLDDASALQQQLKTHFDSLMRLRPGSPLFAIEHGLDAAARANLKNAVQESLRKDGLRQDLWLLWVVYAAENGYTFDGIQFWDNFERLTPGWRGADRQIIRDWFQRFARDYHGMMPVGRWSTHFSIISWPITHAILPIDLQRQLAKALYQAQYVLQGVSDHPFEEIGRALSRSIRHCSQRLRVFLEQEAMLGRIVVSLLGTPEEAAAEIESSALRRIASDLASMRDAQEWLEQAQRTWRARKSLVKARGIISRAKADTSSLVALSRPEGSTPKHVELLNPVSIEAQKIGKDSWQFEITIPSFERIASLDEDCSTFLQQSRFKVPSVGNGMLPNAWLLRGGRRLLLNSWPDSEKPILSFESSPPIRRETDWKLHFPFQRIFVLKIQSDGNARLLFKPQIRAETDYLLVSDETEDLSEIADLCSTNCIGILVWKIQIPSVIPSNLQMRLSSYGLTCVNQLSIAPIGIAPLEWTEDFGGTWLSSAPPLLVISRDHEFDMYRLQLDDGPPLDQAVTSSDALLIQLSDLSIGSHNLWVKTYKSDRSRAHELGTLQTKQNIVITIQPPPTWLASTNNSQALFVKAVPLAPSLEDFLAGDVRLEVRGPQNLSVRVSIVLEGKESIPLLRLHICEQNLPISNESWKNVYRQFIQKALSNPKFYECHSGFMEVSSDAMGSFRITLDRAFSSLRWVLTQRNGNPYLKLIEYVGAEEPTVAFSAFSAPLSETELKNSAGQQGLTIPAQAGLYRATQGEFSDDVVFAPQDVRSLTELQLPRFEQTDKFSNDLAAILDRAILWSKARPLTYLAKHWQSGLVKNLYQTVLIRLCGRKWMTAENKISEGEVTPAQWEEMESLVSFPPNFGIAVGKISIEEETRPDDLKEQLSAKLYRYELHPCDRRLLDVIWRIGWFDTLFLPISANEIEEARSLQVAIRAARLLNLKFAGKTPKVL